jgi:hypothetical protein
MPLGPLVAAYILGFITAAAMFLLFSCTRPPEPGLKIIVGDVYCRIILTGGSGPNNINSKVENKRLTIELHKIFGGNITIKTKVVFE